MAKRQEIFQEERDVLLESKEYYGRSWRDDIQNAWRTGNYKGFPKSHILQCMRNNPNRKWNPLTIQL